MCDADATDINGLVSDDRTIYLACRNKNFLTSTKDAVREKAFEKKGNNHRDGLSAAFSVGEAIQYLTENHGVIRIRVADIHSLGRNLEVRVKISDPSHVIIRNLPCIDKEDERSDANAAAGELASLAEIESAVRVPPQQTMG
jgi:hypothetical protein